MGKGGRFALIRDARQRFGPDGDQDTVRPIMHRYQTAAASECTLNTASKRHPNPQPSVHLQTINNNTFERLANPTLSLIDSDDSTYIPYSTAMYLWPFNAAVSAGSEPTVTGLYFCPHD